MWKAEDRPLEQSSRLCECVIEAGLMASFTALLPSNGNPTGSTSNGDPQTHLRLMQ